MNLELEHDLVLQSQSDVHAFTELYEENYPVILNYVIRRTGDVDLAKCPVCGMVVSHRQ